MAWTAAGDAQLGRWGISVADVECCGLFETPDAARIYSDFAHLPAIVIPYYQPLAPVEHVAFERGPFCRVRYLDQPAIQTGFTARKALRYSQPRQSGVHVYFPALVQWPQVIADPQAPILITEGEAKAIAACAAGFNCVALGGVHSWNVAGTEELIAELLQVAWKGRDVVIAFDSDAVTNANVIAAESRLVDILQLKHGAVCYIARLPPKGESKVGLDDYLKAHGADGLITLLNQTTALGTLDAKIISLNKRIAWIAKEGLIWDFEDRLFLNKHDLISGSQMSALKHTGLAADQRKKPVTVTVAKEWLSHPHANRYTDIVFKPGQPRTLVNEHGRPMLNMWEDWPHTEPGDTAPFETLTEFLFRNMPAEDRGLPLKLLAYKAQNPGTKIPLALVLIGEQGAGKSFWGELVCDAFAPYAHPIHSRDLYATFQPWLERSLYVLINEAEQIDMERSAELLKSLITDLKQPMNDKYRAQRTVESFAQYIFSANEHAVASFARDDRRMIVVETPPKSAWGAQYDAVFDRLVAWRKSGGPRHLLHWLLNHDLQGWQPPKQAPASIEKQLAYEEGLTPIQKIGHAIRENHGANLVLQWIRAADSYYEHGLTANNPTLLEQAQRWKLALPHLQIRPFYEARELALMLPLMLGTDAGMKRYGNLSDGQVSRMLRDEGVPFLRPKVGTKGFLWQAQWRQYLIVQDLEEWRTAALTQQEFENVMRNAPVWTQLRSAR